MKKGHYFTTDLHDRHMIKQRFNVRTEHTHLKLQSDKKKQCCFSLPNFLKFTML